jgi:hypothetical protein
VDVDPARTSACYCTRVMIAWPFSPTKNTSTFTCSVVLAFFALWICLCGRCALSPTLRVTGGAHSAQGPMLLPGHRLIQVQGESVSPEHPPGTKSARYMRSSRPSAPSRSFCCSIVRVTGVDCATRTWLPIAPNLRLETRCGSGAVVCSLVSPDSLGTACPRSGSTYRPVQILEAGSPIRALSSACASSLSSCIRCPREP